MSHQKIALLEYEAEFCSELVTHNLIKPMLHKYHFLVLFLNVDPSTIVKRISKESCITYTEDKTGHFVDIWIESRKFRRNFEKL